MILCGNCGSTNVHYAGFDDNVENRRIYCNDCNTYHNIPEFEYKPPIYPWPLWRIEHNDT